MEAEKLRDIIKSKNDDLEREVLRTAESIIEAIVAQQHLIARATKRVAELRAELVQLEVEELDSAEILGAS